VQASRLAMWPLLQGVLQGERAWRGAERGWARAESRGAEGRCEGSG
jgi:hypothetical protein